MNENFMKEKPVFPLLMSMALPMVISMMVNALYNIVDSFFVAKISEDAMTALSYVFPLQNFVNAVAIGFGVGINAVIAIYLGSKDNERADRAASWGMFLAVIQGIVMTVVCIAIIPSFLRAFKASGDVLDLGCRYADIVFGFSIIISVDLAFEKVFQSVGRMIVTMVGLMGGCIVNIVLDPLLIFGAGPFPEMGIEGAALATGLGQVFTLIIYFIVYFGRPINVKFGIKYLHDGGLMVKKLLCHRYTCHTQYGTAVSAHKRTQRHTQHVFGNLCHDPGRVLQASDLPVYAGKWNHSGNASYHRL